jgi:hypothetical protein
VIGRCLHPPPPRIHPLSPSSARSRAGKVIHGCRQLPPLKNIPKPALAKARCRWFQGAPPRWTFHSPRLGLWLNAVENFFSKMTRQRIRRGVFHSIADLRAAINAYLAEHNASPKPFVWTQSADAILAKIDRLPVTSV